jgi:uncharacterized protein
MDKANAISIIKNFKNMLEEDGLFIDKIVLYGSHARGNPRDDSDLDVVVVSKSFEDKIYWERLELLSSTILKLLEPLEVVALTPKEWDDKKYMAVYYAEKGVIL